MVGRLLRVRIGARGFEPPTSPTPRVRAARLRHAPLRNLSKYPPRVGNVNWRFDGTCAGFHFLRWAIRSHPPKRLSFQLRGCQPECCLFAAPAPVSRPGHFGRPVFRARLFGRPVSRPGQFGRPVSRPPGSCRRWGDAPWRPGWPVRWRVPTSRRNFR